MAKQRVWVVEGAVSNGKAWVALSGRIYDNKRYAYQGLRDVRTHFKHYPKDTFRLAEYIRKQAGGGTR